MLKFKEFLSEMGYSDNALKDFLISHKKALWREIRTNAKLMKILTDHITKGKKLDKSERKFVILKLKDVMRTISAGAVIAIPGGVILLKLVREVLGQDLRPSSYRKEFPKRNKTRYSQQKNINDADSVRDKMLYKGYFENHEK